MENLPGKFDTKIDVKADLTESVTMVVETVLDPAKRGNKGISKLVNACFGPWVATREGKIARIKAQTKYDCLQIESGQNNNNEIISTESSERKDPITLIGRELNNQDTERFLGILGIAMEQIKQIPEEEISDEELDKDFLNKWRRAAEIIENQEMREIWASLLTAEVKLPKSVSKRTLDVVENLSKEEIETFQKLLSSKIMNKENILIKHINNSHYPINNLNYKYKDTISLIDATLLNPSMNSIFLTYANGISLMSENSLYFYYLSYDNKIKHPSFILSSAGKEMAEIMLGGIVKLPNEEQVIEIAKSFFETNKSVNFQLIKVNKINNQQQIIWKSPTENNKK